MMVMGPGLDSQGDFRTFCLYEQQPAEARLMGAAARALRCARRAAGYSRRELATRLGVGVDVVVAIENGYGRLDMAQPLVERAGVLAAQAQR
jgi:DNA-binding XRE family transcriptional regulator